MKELSIEEKAQRYDEALKKAKDFYKGYKQRDNQLYADDLESIFPELKESDDERIRKAIIEGLREMKSSFHTISSIKIDDALAWLEKQGNKDKEILILKDQIESLHAAIKALKEAHKIEIEKQSEQNHANKCKPKFKVGDKIIENNEFGIVGGEITDIDDTHYELDNGCRYIPISQQDNYKLVEKQSIIWSKEDDADFSAAMWAIQQAKTIAKDENDMGNLWCAERFLNSIKDRMKRE